MAVVAGCSHGAANAPEPATTRPPALTPQQKQESSIAVQRSRVLKAFGAFLTAAGKHDAAGMWTMLSRRTQERLGPTLAAFRHNEAKTLAASPGDLASSQGDLLVAEPLSRTFAVIAIGAELGAQHRYTVYAATLRREGNAWKVELGAPVHLTPLRPRADEAVTGGQHQVAAGIVAESAPVADAALWLDGHAVPGEASGNDKRHITVFANLTAQPDPGRHTVVAYARAGREATAIAWTYRLSP